MSNDYGFLTSGSTTPSTAPVNATAATLALSATLHGSKVVTLNRAGGIAVTLPASTGAGTVFTLVIGTTFTSSATIKAANASDSFIGHAFVVSDNSAAMVGFMAAANDDTVTFDGTTTGGYLGGTVVIRDVAANLWHVEVRGKATGTEATPFSATVS